MRADLLKRGADLLRADAANPKGVKFDLGTWVERGDVDHMCSTGSTHAKWTTETLPEVIPVSCGTKACAFGLMAISGEFKAEGLTYRADPAGSYNDTTMVQLLPILDLGFGESNPTAFDAAVKLFDISKDDAVYFFDPCCYDETPFGAQGEILVADRIDAFINGEIDRKHHPDTRHEYDGDALDEDDEG